MEYLNRGIRLSASMMIQREIWTLLDRPLRCAAREATDYDAVLRALMRVHGTVAQLCRNTNR